MDVFVKIGSSFYKVDMGALLQAQQQVNNVTRTRQLGGTNIAFTSPKVGQGMMMSCQQSPICYAYGSGHFEYHLVKPPRFQGYGMVTQVGSKDSCLLDENCYGFGSANVASSVAAQPGLVYSNGLMTEYARPFACDRGLLTRRLEFPQVEDATAQEITNGNEPKRLKRKSEMVKSVSEKQPVTRIKRRRKARSGGTSKYRGVSFHTRDRRYMARLWNSYSGKTEHLGGFLNEKDAARAVDARVLELYGKDDPDVYLNLK